MVGRSVATETTATSTNKVARSERSIWSSVIPTASREFLARAEPPRRFEGGRSEGRAVARRALHDFQRRTAWDDPCGYRSANRRECKICCQAMHAAATSQRSDHGASRAALLRPLEPRALGRRPRQRFYLRRARAPAAVLVARAQ